MTTMKCSHCGATITHDDLIRGACGYCHAAVQAPASHAVPVFPSVPPSTYAPPPPPPMVPMDPYALSRAQIPVLLAARTSFAGVFFRALFLSLLLTGVSVGILAGALDGDPWLGMHAQYFCPRVCPDCHGPYVYFSWTTRSMGTGGNSSDTTAIVYCRSPRARVESMTWMEHMALREFNTPYELPGGWWNLFGSTLAATFALSLPLALLLAWNSARSKRARGRALAAQLDALQRGRYA